MGQLCCGRRTGDHTPTPSCTCGGRGRFRCKPCRGQGWVWHEDRRRMELCQRCYKGWIECAWCNG